nr:MAG TPA: hypothetical protein [Caudoviricetes sp.]
MTREEAKALLPIIQGYVDGKKIETRPKGKYDAEWQEANLPAFNIWECDYRIKPEPKYRPFANAEECLKEMQKHTPFGLIKKNVNGTFYCIGSFDIKNIYIGAKQSIRSYADSLEKFTFVDDTPFGVKVEE